MQHNRPFLLTLFFALCIVLSGCAGQLCKEECETNDDCDDGLVCLSPLGGDAICLPEECESCPDSCAINRDPVAETCDFRGCG